MGASVKMCLVATENIDALHWLQLKPLHNPTSKHMYILNMALLSLILMAIHMLPKI